MTDTNKTKTLKGAKFTAYGRTWIVTGVRTLPYDKTGPKRVFARSDDRYADLMRFGPLDEWLAEFGDQVQ